MTAFRSSILLLAISLLSGCGSSAAGPSATPTTPSTPTGFSSDQPLSIHLAYLRARSYTPDTRLSISLAGGYRLYAIHSVCTGSADGHCQAVDAFLNGQRAPLMHQDYSTVQSLDRIPNGFQVVAKSYKTGDPLCCPSGPTVTDSYVWNGSGLVEHGVLPKPPSG